jgi:hypothetical protein
MITRWTRLRARRTLWAVESLVQVFKQSSKDVSSRLESQEKGRNSKHFFELVDLIGLRAGAYRWARLAARLRT